MADRPGKGRKVIARAALAAFVLSASAALASAPTPEDRLSAVYQAVEANQLDTALRRVDELIRDYPNFRLAHLVRGDLLLARSRPIATFGNVAKTVPQERIEGLREEALARLRAQRDRPGEDRLPRVLLQMRPGQQHAIIVDSRRSRLYVFANDGGQPRLVADYYVTLGKNGVEKTREGDQKTPIGVYHVTATLPRQKLGDFYGAGAFPINYPNEWDRRRGRNGHGIWLHGVPSATYARPPRASDGCIVLANQDLESVSRQLQIGLTPVIIVDEIEWADAAAVRSERESLQAALEQWRADWESRDVERYLSHYSQRFSSGTQDAAAWAAHKRNVNAARRWIKVGVSQVSMFRYPREGDFVVMDFEQDYRSDGLSNAMRKRQYWMKEGGSWKILYEGAA
ncbi:MAG: L,D-transpeptidase family protein [Betaproteobacteria bacterium]|nr:L,D-transpeptidase family protein [Betaproteobacteria bacterium]